MKQTRKGISQLQEYSLGGEQVTAQKNFSWPFRLLAFLIAFIVFFQGPALVAATITWDPFKIYTSASVGSGTSTFGGTFTISGITTPGGHWASGTIGSAVPTINDSVILNLGSSNYSINLLSGTSVSVGSLAVSIGTGAAGTTISLGTFASGTLTVGSLGITVNAGTLSIGSPTKVSLGSSSETWTVNTGSQLIVAGSIVGTGSALTIAGGGLVVFSGSNSYTGGTTLNGGTLSISGSQNLGAGSLAFNSGSLLLSSGGTTSSAVVTLGTTGGTLDVAASSSLTLSGIVSGSGALTKVDAGTLVLSGVNTFQGGLYLNRGAVSFAGTQSLGAGSLNFNSGSLLLSSGGTTTSTAVTLGTTGGTFDVASSSSLTLSGIISGSGALTKVDAGTLVLSGVNTYSGTTTVAAGTLKLTGGTAASSGSIYVSSGAVLDASATTSVAIANKLVLSGTGVSSSGALLTTSGGSLTGSVYLAGDSSFGGNSALTLSGVISDGGAGYALTKVGTGQLTLTGANTYTGTTTINGGSLQIGAGGTTGSLQSNVTINAGSWLVFNRIDAYGGTFTRALSGAGSLQVSSGTLTVSGSNALTGNLTIASSAALVVASSLSSSSFTGNISNAGSLAFNSVTDGTLSGVISGAGSLTQAGNSNLTLSGANTFNGGVKLSAGSITLGGSAGRELGTGTLNLNGGTLSFGTYTAYNIGGLSGSGALTLENASASAVALTVGTATAYSTTYSGVLSGAGSLLVGNIGNGSLTLSGANTYTGGTTLNTGTLAIASATALGTGSLFINGGSLNTISAGTTLSGITGQVWSGNFGFVGTGSLDLGTSDVTLTASRTVTVAASTLTVGGVITDGGLGYGLTKAGAGRLILAANETYTGDTTISGGTLQIGAGGTSGLLVSSTISISSGAYLAFNRSDKYGGDFAPAISGSGNLLLSAGTLTFGGTTQINSGSYAGNIIDNSQLVFSTASDQILSGVISGTGSLTQSGTGLLTLSGVNTFSGSLSISKATLSISNANNLGSGSLYLSGGSLYVSANATTAANRTVLGTTGGTLDVVSGASLTLSGTVSGSGALTKVDAGTLVLSGTNTFTGGLFLNGGSVSVANDTALGSTTSGSLNFNGGTLAINSVSGTSSRAINLNTSGGAVMLAGGSVTFSGTVAGSGSLTLLGNGTLRLTGTNSAFSGSTTVLGGTYLVTSQGAVGSGSIVVSGSTAALDLQTTLLAPNGLVLSGSSGAGTGNLINSSTAGLTGIVNGPITLAGTSVIAGNGSLQIIGAISDGGAGYGLVKSGTNNLILSGSNYYGGGTALNSGIITLGTAYAIGTGSLYVTNGTLSNNSGSKITLQSNTLVLAGSLFYNPNYAPYLDFDTGTGSVILSQYSTISVNNNFFTISGTISGSNGLNKIGGSNLYLTSYNNYTGGTTLTQGQLFLGNGHALGTGSLYITGTNNPGIGGVNGPVILTGISQQVWGGSFGFVGSPLNLGSGSVTLATSPTITVSNNNTFTEPGIISGSYGLTIKGSAASPGRFVLSGSNQFSGGVTLQSGGVILVVSNSLALGTGAFTIQNGGSLDAGTSSITLAGNTQSWAGSFNFLGSNDLDLGTGTVTLTTSPTVTVSAGTLTEGGSITGAFNLTKAGPGTLLLTGSSFYTQTGATYANAGVLRITNPYAVSNTVYLNGGTLEFAGTSDFGFSSSRINLTTSSALSLDLLTAGTGGITQSLSSLTVGTMTLSVLGGKNVTGGTAQLSLGNLYSTGTSTISVSNSVSGARTLLTIGAIQNTFSNPSANLLTFTGSGDVTVTGRISSFGAGLSKSGTGTLQLNGDNTFSGPTTVTAGTLIAGVTGLKVTSSVVVSSTGTLVIPQLSNDSSKATIPLTITNGGSVFITGTPSYISGGTVYTSNNSPLFGTITMNGVSPYLDTLTFTAGTGDFSLTSLNVAGNASKALNFLTSGTIRIDSPPNATAIGLNGGGKLQTFVDAGSQSFDVQPITGSGSLEKIGAGEFVLQGNNTYTGKTTVLGGTLHFTGSSINNLGIINVDNGFLYSEATGGTSNIITVSSLSTALFSGGSPILGTFVTNGTTTVSYPGTTVSLTSLSTGLGGSFNVTDPYTGVSVSGDVGGLGTISLGSLGSPSYGAFSVGGTFLSGTLSIESGSFTGNISGGNLSVKTFANSVQTVSGGSLILGRATSVIGTLTGGTITTVNGGSLQLTSGSYSGGGISGAGALVVVNSGSQLLTLNSGLSTYTGPTTVSGSLVTTVTGALGNTSLLTLNAGSRLNAYDVGRGSSSVSIASGGTAFLSSGSIVLNQVSNAGSLNVGTSSSAGSISLATLSGTGTTTLNAASATIGSLSGGSVTAASIFNAGTVGGGASLFLTAGGTVSVLNDASQVNGTSAGTLYVSSGYSTSTLGGSLALVKQGTGDLYLLGTGSYTGGTTLKSGILSLGLATAIGSGSLTITGGTLDASSAGLSLANDQIWSGSFGFRGNNSLSSSGTVTLTKDITVSVVVTSSTLSVNGAIAGGSYSLTKDGSGTLLLGGSYSLNNLVLSNGVLALGGSYALSGATNIAFNGGVLDLGGLSRTFNSCTFISGGIQNGSTVLNSGTFTIYSFNINTDIGGPGSLLKVGSGVATLGGNNQFDGGVTLSQGTLNVNSNTALGSGSSTVTIGSLGSNNSVTLANTRGADVTLTNNNAQVWSGSFAFNGPNALNVGTGSVTLDPGLANLGITVNSSALTVGGVISGSAGLTVSGPGTLALFGVNTFSGGLNLKSGVLTAGTSGALSTGSVSISGGVVDLQGLGHTIANALTMTGGVLGTAVGTGSINAQNSVIIQAGTVFADVTANSIRKQGTGVAILAGANTINDRTYLESGTLVLNSANSIGNSILTISAGSINNTSGAPITINASQNWNGSFGFIGTNDLTFSDTVTIGTSNMTLTIAGGTLKEAGVISGASNLTKDGLGTLSLFNQNTFSGTLTVSAGTLQLGVQGALSSNVGLHINSGVLDLGGFTQTFGDLQLAAGVIVRNGTISFSSSQTVYAGDFNIALTGTGSILKVGTSAATLLQPASFEGGTTINEGTLYLADNNALGTGTLIINGTGSSTGFGVKSGSYTTIAGNNNQIWSGTFSFSGGTLDSGTGTVTLNSNVFLNVGSGTLKEGGVISGTSAAFGLTKSGTGTLVLSNANLYTGTTAVTGGSLFSTDLGQSGSLSIGTYGAVYLSSTNFSVVPVSNAGSLTFTAASGTITFGTLKGTGYTAVGTLGSSLDAVVSGGISSGTVSVTGTLSTSISGGNVTAGAVTLGSLSAGLLTLTNGAALSTIGTLTGGSITDNGSLQLSGGRTTGIFGGTGSLTIGSSGLRLEGANTFSGTLGIQSGSLVALRFGAATLNIGSAANVDITGSGGMTLKDVTNAGSLKFSGTSGTIVINGSLNNSGVTSFLSNGSIAAGVDTGTLNATGLLTIGGSITGGILNVGALSAPTTNLVYVNQVADLNDYSFISDGTVRSGTVTGGSLTINGKLILGSMLGGTINVTANQPTYFKRDILGGSLITQGNLQVDGDVDNAAVSALQTAKFGSISGGTIFIKGASTIDSFNGGSLTITGESEIKLLNGGNITMNAPLIVREGNYTGVDGGLLGGGVFTKKTTVEKTGLNYLNVMADVPSITGTGRVPGGAIVSGTYIAIGTGSVDGAGVLTRKDTGYRLVRDQRTLVLSGTNYYSGDTVLTNGITVIDAGAIPNTKRIFVNGGYEDYGNGYVNVDPVTGTALSASGLGYAYNGTISVGTRSGNGVITVDVHGYALGGSLTAVDVSSTGNTSLSVGTMAIATFTGSDLKFSSIVNDAQDHYEIGALTGLGKAMFGQTGLYFTSTTGTITIGTGGLSGAGFTHFYSNLATSDGGILAPVTPSSPYFASSYGVVVDGILFGDVSQGRFNVGQIDNGSISGGFIVVNGAVHMRGVFSGGQMTVSGTANIEGGVTGGSLTLLGESVLGSYTGSVGNADGSGLLARNNLTIGTINGSLYLRGSLTVSSGTLSGLSLPPGDVGGIGGVTKIGSNTTLLMSGTNTQSSTTLNAGTLLFDSVSAIGSGALTINGGSLGIGGTSAISFSNRLQNWNGDFTFTGTQNMTFTGGVVTLGNNVAVTIASATLTESVSNITGAYSFTKKGNGTLLLNNAAADFSGGFSASGGTVTVSQIGALGSGALTVDSGSKLYLGNTTQTVAGFVLGGSTPTTGYVYGGTILADAFTLYAGSVDSTTKFADRSVYSPASLTKSGSAAVTVSGSLGYTGSTTVEAGTLVLTAGSLGLSTVSVQAAGSLSFSATAGSISVTSLTDEGVVQFGKDAVLTTLTGTSGSGTVTSTGGGTLYVSSGSFNGNISGATSLVKQGSGTTLTLGGTTSYTGSTVVNFGTLSASVSGALGSTTSISVGGGSVGSAGGFLDVVDYNPAVALSIGTYAGAKVSGANLSLGTLGNGVVNAGSLSFTATSGSITLGSLTGGGATSFESNAVIGGSIASGIVKVADTATLYASVTGGTVKTGALVTGGLPLFGGSVTLNGGSSAITSVTGGASVSLGSNATLKINSGTLSSFSGSGTLLKVGSLDTLNFTSASAFTGTLEVQAGTLVSANFNAAARLTIDTLGNATFSNDNLNLGTVSNSGSLTFSGANITLGTLTLSATGSIVVSGSQGTFKVTQVDGGSISGGNISVAAGTLDLGTYGISGGVVKVDRLVAQFITGGSITIGSATSGGISQVGVVSSGTLFNNATLQINSGSLLSRVDGNGILLKSGTDSDVLNIEAGVLPGVKGVSVLGGTLVAVDFGAGASVPASAAYLYIGSLGTANISGSGLVIGTVTSVGSSNFTGGTLTLANLGGSGATTFAQDATITGALSDGTVTVGGSFSAGALTGGLVTLSGSYATIGLLNGGTLTSDGSVTLTGLGTTSLGGTSAVASGTGGTVLHGAMSLLMNGSGAVSLAGASDFTGGTTLNNGTLNLNNPFALGAGSLTINGGSLDNTSGSAVTLTDHFETWNNSFTYIGSNSSLLNLGSLSTITIGGTSALTLSVNAGTLLLGGTIVGGSNGFTKAGDGYLLLNGSVSFSDGTTTGSLNVNGGSLLLGGSSSLSGAVLTVSKGSVDLSGKTQQVGDVTLSAGGYIGNGSLNSSGSISIDAGTIAAVISGNSVVTKSGSGSASLNNPNDYRGGTVVTGGTLNINDGGAIGGGTLTLGSVTPSLNSVGIGLGTTLSGGTVLSTNNAQIWNGDFSFNGNGNTLDMGTGAITMARSLTITVNSGSLFERGVIAGAGTSGLTKAGNGTLLLSGSNNYSGGTVVNGGLLLLKGTNALGSLNGALTIDSGVVDLDNSNQQVGDVRLSSGGYIKNGTISTSGTVNLSAGTIDASIAGAGSVLLDSGSGTGTLSQPNSYQGGTHVKSGTLNITNSTALGAGSSTLYMEGGNLANLSGGSIQLSNNNLQSWTKDFSFSGGTSNSLLDMGTGLVTVSGTGETSRVVTVNSGTLLEGGVILGGNLGLVKSGEGLLILSGSTNFAGGLTVNAGTLSLGSTGTLGTVSLLNAAGGVFDLGGGSQSFAQVNLTGGVLANGTLVSGTYALQSGTISAVVSGGANGVSKTGAGSAWLTGANTYTGVTTVSQGTLTAGSGALASTSAINVNGGSLSLIDFNPNAVLTVGTYGVLNFSDATSGITLGSLQASTLNGLTTFANNGTLNFAVNKGSFLAVGTLYSNNGINGGVVTASVLEAGSVSGGSVTTTSATGISKVTALTGGTFSLGGVLQVRSGSYAGGGISGSGSLEKVGDGTTLVLGGSNSYSGATTVTAGTLSALSGALASTGSINVNGGSLVAVNFGATPNVTVGTVGTALVTGSAVAGAVQNDGVLEFRTTASVASLGGTGITTFSGSTASIGSLKNGTLNGVAALSVSSGSHTAGVIGGSLSLEKVGSGALTLAATGSYTGGTKVSAGTLNINKSDALGTGSLTLVSGATLDNTSGAAITTASISSISAGSFTFAGSNDLSLSTTPLSLGSSVVWAVNASTLTLSGNISGGSYAIAKTGAGRLVLGGSNTFSGGLTVFGGTLAINSGTAIGQGLLVMKDGTTLDVGSDMLSLNAFSLEGSANVNFSSTAKLAFTGSYVASTGTVTASLSGAGSLTKSGSGTIVLSGSNSFTGGATISAGTVDLRNNSALSTGTVTITGGATIDAGTQNITLANNSVVLAGSIAFLGTNDLNLGAGSVSLTQDTALATVAGTLTVGGSVSGSGGLTKSGDGTLKLTSSELLYTGSTTVSAGSLSFAPTGSGTATLSSPLVLGGSGTVSVDSGKLLKLTVIASSGGTLAGSGSVQVGTVSVASGSNLNVTTTLTGSVAKTGNGALTLSGSNALSSVALSQGALNLANAGALGTGVLTVTGGSLDSTVSGGTVLTGASQAWNGSFTFVGSSALNTGSGAVSVSATPTLAVNGSTLTVSTPLTGGTTGLVKTGAGVLKLAGSTFTGTTSVTQGTLEYVTGASVSGGVVVSGSSALSLDGNFAAGAVTVGSQSVVAVGGGGTFNAGTFSFGSSASEKGGAIQTKSGASTSFVGTLKGSGSISGGGALVFGAGAVLDIGYSPGQLLVSSGATMVVASGATMNYQYNPSLPGTDTYLQAGTTELSSDRIVVQSGGSLTFQNAATLTLTASSTSGKALAPGVSAVYPVVVVLGGTINALDAGSSYTSVTNATVNNYFKIGNASSTVVSGTFSQLAGGTVNVTLTRRSYQSVSASAGNNLKVASVLDSILLAGSYSTGISNLFTSLDSKTSVADLDVVLAALNPAPYAELASLGMNRVMDLQSAIQGHLDTLALGVLSDYEPSEGEAAVMNAWTSAYGGWANRDGNAQQGLPGYSSSNYGNISGVERRFGDLTLGITGAVGSTSATFKQTNGSLSADTWHAGLYASAPFEFDDFGLILDAGLLYGQGDSTVKRSAAAAGLGTFTGKVTSTEWLGKVGFSFPSILPDDTFTVTPSMHLLLASYSQSALTEGSLTGLEAKVAAYSQMSAATRLGLQGAKLLRVGQLPARLTASLNWLHSFDSTGRQVDIGFSGGNSTAKFTGSSSGMDAVRIGLGGEVAITDRTRFLLTIDHQLQKGQSATTGNASVGVQF
jgi:fibronectin-binding autotransporter adhesin